MDGPNDSEALVGVGRGALDEHGKAIFGCPGPGTYAAPTTFNNKPLNYESPAGKHVFTFPGAFTIKGRSKQSEWAADSPGPAAHQPSYNRIEPQSKRAPFGTAERDTEAKRFISHCHPSGDTTQAPGPGAYRYKCGKGHSGTIGDGPMVKIGTGAREAAAAAATTPGAKYDVPGAFDVESGHGFSIAPLGDRDRGAARDRAAEGDKYCRQYWGPGTEAPVMHDGPSPLKYRPNKDALSTAFPPGPSTSFGKASLEVGAKISPGSKAFEGVRYGSESPAKLYDPVSTLSAISAAMPQAPRFGRPGAHDATPAADYDHERFINATKSVASGCTMTRAQRAPPQSTSLESPGAPAYLIKHDAAHYRYSTAAGHSLGARTDWAGRTTGADVPGPGSYKVATGISQPDLRQKREPAAPMGRVCGREGRSTSLISSSAREVPGPGQYPANIANPVGEASPSFSFGRRDGISAETLSRSRLGKVRTQEAHKGEPKRFYSSMQARSMAGHESPGTGQFNLSGTVGRGKNPQLLKQYTGKMTRTGRAKDRKRFISQGHVADMQGGDSPGPGMYAPRTAMWDDASSKFARNGGCAFGKSLRPPLARVLF